MGSLTEVTVEVEVDPFQVKVSVRPSASVTVLSWATLPRSTTL